MTTTLEPAVPNAPTVADEPNRPATGPHTVDVVIVARDGAAWLGQCLDSLAAQTVRPDRVVVVDNASSDSTTALARAHHGLHTRCGAVRIERLDTVRPFGQALAHGIDSLPAARADVADRPAEWVWVLHDCAPATPDTLAHLLGRATRGDGIVGPKIVGWDDPRRLVELGLAVTRSGRAIARPERGEADQGQHDDLADVLAVPTSGMLIRRSVWDELGGIDPSFARAGGALDLGWRTHLLGPRVVVDPGARVRDVAAAGAPGEPFAPLQGAAERRERRAMRRVALARRSLPGSIALAVWLAVTSLVLGALLLVAKRPKRAWRELSDVAALAHPVQVIGARWRGRRTRRARRADLSTLFVDPSTAARLAVMRVQDEVSPDRGRRTARPGAAGPAGVVESGPQGEETESLEAAPASLARTVLGHPGVLVVVLALLTSTMAWRSLIAAGALSPTTSGVVGGELFPVPTNAAGLWDAFRDAWSGSGFGGPAEGGPGLAVLAALTWICQLVPGVDATRSPAGLSLTWLLFLAPGLAAWTAYLSARVICTARVPRALAALAWGLATPLLAAVGHGRVTFALAHVLVPLAAAGFVLAARRTGTWTATFATALVTAVVLALVPAWAFVLIPAALGLTLAAPGWARLRGLTLLVVPVALLGPWVLRFQQDWTLLLGGPGLVTTSTGSTPLALALLHPEPVSGPWLWTTAGVLGLGLIGLAAPARSTRARVGLAATAVAGLVGLAGALAAPHVVLGSATSADAASAPAGPWPGVGLSLWLLLLAVGVALGAGALTRGGDAVLGGRRRWSRLAVGAAVTLAALSPLAGAANAAWHGFATTLSVERAILPAVALEAAIGPGAGRLLLLHPSERVVDVELVGREPGEVLRDLDPPSGPVTADGASSASSALTNAVADLVGGTGTQTPDATVLSELGIAFLQADVAASDPLAARLDATKGLSRLGSTGETVLWKVLPPEGAAMLAPTRLRIDNAAGEVLAGVDSTGPHGATDVDVAAGPPSRRLVVAEPLDWAQHAVVTYAGSRLSALPGTSQPTYELPPTAGRLVIDLAAAHPWWRVGQGALLALVVFLAVPFGNRRSRRRT